MQEFSKFFEYNENDPEYRFQISERGHGKLYFMLSRIRKDLINSYGFHFKRMMWKYRMRESFTADAVCVQRDIQLLDKFFGIPSKTLLEAYSRAFKRLEVEYLIGKRKREEEARKKLEAQLEFKVKLNSLYGEFAEKRKKLLDEASSLGIEITNPDEEDPL